MKRYQKNTLFWPPLGPTPLGTQRTLHYNTPAALHLLAGPRVQLCPCGSSAGGGDCGGSHDSGGKDSGSGVVVLGETGRTG